MILDVRTVMSKSDRVHGPEGRCRGDLSDSMTGQIVQGEFSESYHGPRLINSVAVTVLAACFLFALGVAPANGALSNRDRFIGQQAVTLRFQTIDGIALKIVDANLSDPHVVVTAQIATGGSGNAEPFSTLLSRSRPTAAINGAYFSKEGLTPIGDIVINGQCVCQGDFKTALVITRDKRASVVRHSINERVDWSEFDTVLCCGPALVLDGKIDWEPDARNHRDSHVTGSTSRMGVGVTPDNHLLLIAATGSMDFGHWAQVMKDLGCRDAMNLDSGASRALYYRGQHLSDPGRNLTNLLLVYESIPAPAQAVLVPIRSTAAAPRSGTITRAIVIPSDEATSSDPRAVTVKICGESGKRASSWCPASISRRLLKNHIPGPCPLHRPPPGEG